MSTRSRVTGVPGRPRLHIVDDPAAAAADTIAALLESALRHRGAATIAVSGGSTAPDLFSTLATVELPWSRVGVWQVDERVAPDGDPDRNANQLAALAGTHHPMPVTEHDLGAAADRYGDSLPARFDVVHLGVGADGHTASWPPGDPVIDVDAPVALSQPYQGRVRMTLTPGPVNAAAARVVLVRGEDKADALGRWLGGADSLPIARVVATGTTVCCDPAAAGGLTAS